MKKKYIDPEIEVVLFHAEDVIATSSEIGDGEFEAGGDYEDIP